MWRGIRELTFGWPPNVKLVRTPGDEEPLDGLSSSPRTKAAALFAGSDEGERITVKDATLSATDFGPGQLPAGPQMPKGDTGPRGPAGAQGEPAATLFAAC